jgi:hypothetical protein
MLNKLGANTTKLWRMAVTGVVYAQMMHNHNNAKELQAKTRSIPDRE